MWSLQSILLSRCVEELWENEGLWKKESTVKSEDREHKFRRN